MYSKIHDNFWNSTKRKSMTDGDKLLFAYLITCKHRNIIGLYYLPLEYAAADLGWKVETVSKRLGILSDSGLVKYDKQSNLVLVVNFLEHNPLPNANTEKKAVKTFEALPESPLFQVFLTVLKQLPEQYRNLIETVTQTVSNTKAEAEAVIEEDKSSSCSEPKNDSEPTAIISLPLNDGSEYNVTESFTKELSELYPVVDIMQELRKMKAWLLTNPAKRKTKKGVTRFINSWLSREQDRGGRKTGPPMESGADKTQWK